MRKRVPYTDTLFLFIPVHQHLRHLYSSFYMQRSGKHYSASTSESIAKDFISPSLSTCS